MHKDEPTPAPVVTDATNLLTRLRAREFSGQYAMGGGSVATDGAGKTTGTSWGGEKIMRSRNPDGCEAASLIEKLLAMQAAQPVVTDAMIELLASWLGEIGPLPIDPDWTYTVIRHGNRNMDLDIAEGFNEPERQCGAAFAHIINMMPAVIERLAMQAAQHVVPDAPAIKGTDT